MVVLHLLCSAVAGVTRDTRVVWLVAPQSLVGSLVSDPNEAELKALSVIHCKCMPITVLMKSVIPQVV